MPKIPFAMRRFFDGVWLAVGVISLGIVFAYELGSGVVLDQATGKPVPDVFVISKWTGRVIRPLGGSEQCFKIDVSKTDASGRFVSWPISWDLNPFRWSREREMLFYGPGYSRQDIRFFGKLVAVKRSTLSTSGRNKVLHGIANRLVCEGGKGERTFVVPLLQKMLEESRSLGIDPEAPGFQDDFKNEFRIDRYGSAVVEELS